MPIRATQIQAAYSEWASTYDHDRNLTRDLDAEITRAELHDLRPDTVVELGCGTGKNTVFYAELAPRVEALDFSAGMLAQARTKVHAHHVHFTQTDLTQAWPIPPAHADLIAGNLVLEHIADLGHIFSEAARVLQPGGLLFLCELHPYRQYAGKQARYNQDQATIEIPAWLHHTSEFTEAASAHGFILRRLREWWHDEDRAAPAPKPPRLISFLFERAS